MFVLEVAAATVLLAAVAVLLVTSLHARQRVDERMATRLAAMDAARATLLNLQNGTPVPQSPTVHLERRVLQTPAAQGKQWIMVRATAGDEHVELCGQVPAVQSPASPEVAR
jgi:hypothetical protein